MNLSDSHMQVLSCLLLLFSSVATTLFANASKSSDGSYPYDTFIIPTLVETLKLICSSVVLIVMEISGNSTKITLSAKRFVSFSLPALCYFVSNNCVFHIIRLLGATNFQILSNLKILCTALLMRMILGRNVSWIRWKALGILTLGSMVSQISCEQSAAGDSPLGYLLLLVYCMSSSAGGIASEKLLKGKAVASADSIHWQNFQLYAFGVAFGALTVMTHSNSELWKLGDYFHGMNAEAVATVLCMTCSGLLVSYILKYLDNMVKCFVITGSMFLVALCSSFVKHEFPSMQLTTGIVLCCLAVEQYYISGHERTLPTRSGGTCDAPAFRLRT